MSEIIPINLLIVPSIAVPIASFSVALDSVTHLWGLEPAHPITTDQNFQIFLLITTGHLYKIRLLGKKVPLPKVKTQISFVWTTSLLKQSSVIISHITDQHYN